MHRYQACGSCGGNLEVVYTEKPRFKKSNGERFWSYEYLLPKARYRHTELGGTKLISSSDDERLFLKLEIENPTRSFKDRGSIVEIAKAKEYGYETIVCASTGNMAYSLAYYAKLEDMRARVFIGGSASKHKVRNIKELQDADVEKVDGDFNKALDVAYKYAARHKAFLAGDYCYRKEGQKTLIYEIMDQLHDATHIIVPVGNATLLSGIFKGLKEMKQAGHIKKLPKIVAVQARKCSPLVKAFANGEKIKYQKPMTAADAIAVGYPTFGDDALGMLRTSKGMAMAVSESEMLKEQKRFLEDYGLVAELASVSTVAAYKKLKLKENEKAVAIISGGNV
jgi:threonine synthase